MRKTTALQADGWVTTCVLAAAFFIGAVVAGSVDRALGHLVRALWLADNWIGSASLTASRRRRWQSARQAAATAERRGDRDQYERFARVRASISPAEPQRPTWMGDRIAAVDARVRAQYGLDLASTWPRLWLLLSPAIREEVTRATEAWSRSGALAGWGLLYAAIGPWWWPCVLVGIAVFLIGWHAGRQAISELSVLVEAAVDVFGTELASALGVETPSGRLDAGSGRKITALLRKGS